MKKLCIYITITFLIITGGCSGEENGNMTIMVSAAIAFKDVMDELETVYKKNNPGVQLNFNFASSGTLQYQIEQGAPVDVFISAGEKQMDALLEKGLVTGVKKIGSNELVFITPTAHDTIVTGMNEIIGTDFKKIAIGNPDTVPAGQYSFESLKNSGLLEVVSDRLVFAKDVRQVLMYVETRNVDAGFVYWSDALGSDKVNVAFRVPGYLHSPIIYSAAPVKASKNQLQAREFIEFLEKEEFKVILEKHGFKPAET